MIGGAVSASSIAPVIPASTALLPSRNTCRQPLPAARRRELFKFARRNTPKTFNAGLSSFINEARMLAKFSIPGLVEVFRFWKAMALPTWRCAITAA